MPRRIKVLYVEDHTDTLRVIAYALDKKGLEVLSANSVAAGITLGRAADFDVLVSDIMLSDGNGWDVLEALRIIKSFPSIALTARSLEVEKTEILAHGFDRVIHKPFHVSTLMDVVEELFLSATQKAA